MTAVARADVVNVQEVSQLCRSWWADWGVCPSREGVWGDIGLACDVNGGECEGKELDTLVSDPGVGNHVQGLGGEDGKQGLVVYCQKEGQA